MSESLELPAALVRAAYADAASYLAHLAGDVPATDWDKPGLGVDINPDVAKAHLAPGETWWG